LTSPSRVKARVPIPLIFGEPRLLSVAHVVEMFELLPNEPTGSAFRGNARRRDAADR
jgi:hypothetical protein